MRSLRYPAWVTIAAPTLLVAVVWECAAADWVCELPGVIRGGLLGGLTLAAWLPIGWALGRLRRHTELAETRQSNTQINRLGAIVAGLQEPLIAVDDVGKLVLANDSAEKLFSLSPESVGQQDLSQLVRCEQIVELLQDSCQSEAQTVRTAEVEIADEQGQLRWYSVSVRGLCLVAAPTASEAGPQGAVAVLRDISAQKAAQKRNAEIVSAVSHEMKTPLAGIKAYVELLIDGDADNVETQAEFLAVINSQANRLQRLVDNLLNLSRIEAGVVNINKYSQSLNEVLHEAFQLVQPAGESKNIELVAELSPLYLGVLVDRDMLLQAATNLLSNAVKYTRPGGRVVLRSRRVENDVRFEVADTGVGLEPDDCRKVFEKFYRVPKDKDMGTGTGLGLPLAKHIVEDVHGGRLWVESVPGRGSVFAVSLPWVAQLC